MIKRFVFNELKEEINRPEIKILLGPRQVGKTTLLHELERHARTLGLKTSFFDLEQPQVLAGFNRSDKNIAEIVKSSGDVVFIDEFQYIPNASKILKAIHDSGSAVKIFCSGSSSLEIHKHLKESLAGRRMIFKIHPIGYEETKASGGSEGFESYLRFGGMPGLIEADSEERKIKVLSELLSAYVLKDIKSLIKEENIRAFNHLMYLLAQNQGSLVSVHALAGEVALSVKTLSKYLDILEKTFVNFRVHSYSNNLGNELKKSCKTYLYDLGMRNSLLKDFSAMNSRPDRGVIFETYVFLVLHAALQPNTEIKFWRTKAGDEVDFIWVMDRKPFPIEVKSGLPSLVIPKGLLRFLDRYPRTSVAMVVNDRHEGALAKGACQVRFVRFENFDTSMFVTKIK